MHFYRVPKLGSYLAIKMEYDSCLYEEAYDSAVSDYMEVRNKRKEQEDEKRQYFDKIADDLDNVN